MPVCQRRLIIINAPARKRHHSDSFMVNDKHSSFDMNNGPEGERAPLARYNQIKRSILYKINSGQWPAHHKIPSENELSALFQVSRMTVNRALRELTAQGLLFRLQGVGTFVADSSKIGAALMSVRDIAEEIKSHQNHQHQTEIILLEQLKATADMALLLGIKAGKKLFHSLLIHYDNNIPVQLEDRYVNAAAAPDYLKKDFTAQTPHAYLKSVAPITEGEHIVEAVLPSAQEAAWLDIEVSEPCLQLRRTTWSNDLVVTVVRLLYPGSRYRLEGRFHS